MMAVASYHAVGGSISLLNVSSLFNRLLANNLNPVSIRVQGKCNVLHTPVGKLLLELVSSILDALASGLEVVDGDASVAKSSVWILVSVVDSVGRVILSAVVVSEFDDTLTVDARISKRNGTLVVVGQEVEIKLGFREFKLADHAHSKELVKLDWREK